MAKESEKRVKLNDFFKQQEHTKTGLFALEELPTAESMVRLYFYFGAEEILFDFYIDIPREAIDVIIPTDKMGIFRGIEFPLVHVVFSQGETGRIHLENLFLQMNRSKTVRHLGKYIKSLAKGNVKDRRGAKVDAVVPRRETLTGEMQGLTPFQRPTT